MLLEWIRYHVYQLQFRLMKMPHNQRTHLIMGAFLIMGVFSMLLTQ